jgi:hypothetical protein
VRPSNFDGLVWEDGQSYAVPGVSSLRTVLHAGKWAIATGVGTVLLCFRPYITSGPIVICTAAVSGRPTGVRLEEQRRLLARILSEAERLAAPSDQNELKTRPTQPAPDLETYLREEGPAGAALLLALIACNGNKAADLGNSVKARIGVEIDPVELQQVLSRLPESSSPEMAAALRASGWGAHLRRVEQALSAT